MKIECPQCHKELPNYKSGDLAEHIWDRHDDDSTVLILSILIEKIYEKIELLRYRKKIEGRQEVPMPTDYVIAIFESLLDRKK